MAVRGREAGANSMVHYCCCSHVETLIDSYSPLPLLHFSLRDPCLLPTLSEDCSSWHFPCLAFRVAKPASWCSSDDKEELLRKSHPTLASTPSQLGLSRLCLRYFSCSCFLASSTPPLLRQYGRPPSSYATSPSQCRIRQNSNLPPCRHRCHPPVLTTITARASFRYPLHTL